MKIRNARELEEEARRVVDRSDLYTAASQKRLAHNRFGKHHLEGTRKGYHQIDLLVTEPEPGNADGERKILVSCKWQEVSGTAEQKVPYEIMCLAYAVETEEAADTAYLIIAGPGWTLGSLYFSREPYQGEMGLSRYLQGVNDVKVVTLEQFTELVDQEEL